MVRGDFGTQNRVYLGKPPNLSRPPLRLGWEYIKNISQPQNWGNRVKFETPSPLFGGMVSQVLPGYEFRSLP